jgi:hypothetical protein
MVRIPPKDEFLHVIAVYGGHNEYYFEALAGLQMNWGDAEKMADAIWPWLRNWHSSFYMYGDGDPKAIALAIEKDFKVIDKFHDRQIGTLTAIDTPDINRLFGRFAIASGRQNRNGRQSTPVGAAKILHSLCPNFLPMGDDKIFGYYDCELNEDGYLKFCRITKQFAATVRPYLAHSDDRSVLKRIDEFNYSYITESHR